MPGVAHGLRVRMAHSQRDIDEMTPPERLDLIGRLWESLAPGDVPLSPEQRRVLDRRLDRIERDGPTGITPDELRARLRQSAR